MKIHKKRTITLSILLILICSAWLLYRELEPSRHFQHAELPVLAMPEATTSPDELKSSTDTLPSGRKQDPSPVSFNILLLATDARGNEASRTDVIMLAHVDPQNRSVNLLSIPRDTRVQLKGIGYTKINHAHALGETQSKGNQSGTQSTIQAVSNLCRCTINYYVKTNFEGFQHFIDEIGGIDIDLQAPVKLTYSLTTLPKGEQHLDGQTTLLFVRERKSLSEGDHGRRQHQVLVLKAIAQKLMQANNLSRLPDLIDRAQKDILDTNLSKSDMISLAWVAKEAGVEGFNHIQLPGTNGKAYDPLIQKELYYWIVDDQKWETMSKRLFP